GNLSFTQCMGPSNQTSTPSNQPSAEAKQLAELAHMPKEIVDHITYISIIFTILGLSYTIVKWVSMYMKRSILWRLGYVCITLVAICSRVYLMSTLGTYWDTRKWLFINFYWLAPLISCNIASMIYS
ncbi:unnamed protein product, partial [Meganyctiphanes norvegica]